MRKKLLSFLLISLMMTFASCGGKKTEESKGHHVVLGDQL